MSNASSKDSPSEQNTAVASWRSIPWNPVVAVLVVVAIYFASQVIGGLLVSVYPFLKHWSEARANDWLNNSVGAQFVYIVLAEGLTLGLLWMFLSRYKWTFRQLGLLRPKLIDIFYTLGGLVVYFAAYLVLLSVATQLVPSLNVNQQQQVGFQTASGLSQLALTAVSLVILPPLVEEILVRGFLYSSLRKHLSKLVAALITSVIFASAHLQWGSGAPLLWVAAIDTFTLSLVLCYLREKTGRLAAGMGVHALKNAIAFATLFIFHAH